MSQNPYGHNPSNPNYPDIQNTVDAGSQPPSGPNPAFPYPSPGPNPNTPHSSYGPYGNPSTPPPPPGSNIGSNPYDPYAPTAIMGQQPNASPVYPAYNPQPEMMGTSSTPQPPRNKGRSKMVLVAVIALMAIIGASVFGAVAYNNNNQATMHANATATANAQIRSQATANMQATATAVASTYPFSNKLVLNDPLTDNSRGVSWDENSHCSFSGSAYQAIVDKPGYYYPCIATKTSFSNFTFEVQMTIKQGDNGASGGLIFRASPNNRQYLLYLDTQGNYELDVSVDRTGTNSRIVKRGQVTGFSAGLYQVHTLGVVANGNQISLYVDQQSVIQLTDPTYTSGEIGILAYSASSTADIAYNNLKVWQL